MHTRGEARGEKVRKSCDEEAGKCFDSRSELKSQQKHENVFPVCFRREG